MYHVYVIKNDSGKYYIGVTSDLFKRLEKHNHQGSRWTKNKGLWHMVYQEEIETKTEALKREHCIKKYKGGRAFNIFISERCERG